MLRRIIAELLLFARLLSESTAFWHVLPRGFGRIVGDSGEGLLGGTPAGRNPCIFCSILLISVKYNGLIIGDLRKSSQ